MRQVTQNELSDMLKIDETGLGWPCRVLNNFLLKVYIKLLLNLAAAEENILHPQHPIIAIQLTLSYNFTGSSTSFVPSSLLLPTAWWMGGVDSGARTRAGASTGRCVYWVLRILGVLGVLTRRYCYWECQEGVALSGRSCSWRTCFWRSCYRRCGHREP
jgi:hypothetical protein